MYSLTEKQGKLLAYIKDSMAECNVAPSFEQMRDHMGLRSKSGVHRILTGLEKRGYVRRLKHHARAIELL